MPTGTAFGGPERTTSGRNLITNGTCAIVTALGLYKLIPARGL
jgi:hypothetical protein